jgi:2-dehydropantoate 2-reductase
LCFVCLNRVEPGVIQHTDHGQVVLGEFQRPPSARTRELAALFCEAGVPCEVTERLAQAHWEKLVWNVPFNGLGVAGMAGYEAVLRGVLPPDQSRIAASCLPTDTLLKDPHWAQLLRELMNEVIAAAKALGMPVLPELADRLFALTGTMGAYKASTLLDYEKGLPLELESLFLEPLRQARRAGVPTPRLENLCRVLSALDAR